MNKVCIWIPNCHREIKLNVKVSGAVFSLFILMVLLIVQKTGDGGENREEPLVIFHLYINLSICNVHPIFQTSVVMLTFTTRTAEEKNLG